MQTISGIHYNFSVSEELLNTLFEKQLSRDEISNLYMGLVRNFHRYCWILLYLFGASPAVCKSFLRENDQHGLEAFDSVSYYGPYATTLRMSDLGYRNVAQSRIQIGLCNVDTYVSGLRDATEQSYDDYEDIGVNDDGEYRQLNTNILQIENEYYTVIRPKQVIQSGEKPTTALRNNGIAYVEVRCLDINPDSAVGIDKQDIRFVDTFLLYCLLMDSPVMSDNEKADVPENRNRIVRYGRQPDLKLLENGRDISSRQTMEEFLGRLTPIASLLDQAHCHDWHSRSLANQLEKVRHPQTTPAARIITEMQDNKESFFEYAQRKTVEHETDLKQPLDESTKKMLETASLESATAQQQREQADSLDFDDYLQAYFNETLGV
jgi:glutamate--cysteine ligase